MLSLLCLGALTCPDLWLVLTWYKVPFTLQPVQPVQETNRSAHPLLPPCLPPSILTAASLLGTQVPTPSLECPSTGPQALAFPLVRLARGSGSSWLPQDHWAGTLTALLAGAAGPLFVGQDLLGALRTVCRWRAVAGVAGCGGREGGTQGPVSSPGSPGVLTAQGVGGRLSRGHQSPKG